MVQKLSKQVTTRLFVFEIFKFMMNNLESMHAITNAYK